MASAGISAPQTQDAAIGQTGAVEFGAPKRFKAESVLGLVVLGLGIAWIVWSFASGPTLFMQVLTIGLSNGALYALIALGYTMVYGIIELINFAHGDLFMLGSVVGAIFLEDWIGEKSSSAVGWAW